MLTRRLFLKRAAFAAGAVSAARFFPGPNLLAAPGALNKLNCVQIGCGGRGFGSHLSWLVNTSGDNVVAIVDPDEKAYAKVRKLLQSKGNDPAKLEAFTDYRVMFDKVGKQVDAVFVATPN